MVVDAEMDVAKAAVGYDRNCECGCGLDLPWDRMEVVGAVVWCGHLLRHSGPSSQQESNKHGWHVTRKRQCERWPNTTKMNPKSMVDTIDHIARRSHKKGVRRMDTRIYNAQHGIQRNIL